MKNLFPREITNAISGIDDELRQGILSFLILNEKATYSTIKNTFNATNGNLNHHLNLLVIDSLLTKTLEKENGKTNSYYHISAYGKEFINSLFYSLKPKSSSLHKTFMVQYEKEQKQNIGILTPILAVSTIKHLKTKSEIPIKSKQPNEFRKINSLSALNPMMEQQ